MKGLVKLAPEPGAVAWTDCAEPVVGPGEVVVSVEAAGICGTDLSVYKWARELAEAYQWPIPLLLGHEFAGRIVSVGAGVEGFAPGDLVSANPIQSCEDCFYCRNGMSEVCNDRPQVGLNLPGAFAPFTKVRARNVIHIPAGVDSHVAALSEPLAVAVHALDRVRFAPGEAVVVAGAGPIGLLIALAARHGGASRVFVTGLGRDEVRLAIARDLGCVPLNVESVDPLAAVREATEGRGADVTLEAGGHPSAVLQAVQLTRKGGRIGLVGLPHDATTLSTSAIALQEKELIGCRAYTQETWRRVESLLPVLKDDLTKLITHRMPMAEGVAALKLALAGAGAKILLEPDTTA